MKNLKSLQALGLAGVAIAFTSGCSSTGMGQNDSSDSNATYRFASSGGWAPITDVRQMNSYPQGRYWTPNDFSPVSYESYTFAVPAVDQSASASQASSFSEDLQPGDTFVEAAGADSSGSVKQVIKYTPFATTGLGH